MNWSSRQHSTPMAMEDDEMKKKATDSVPESYPMNGGDGRFSYYKNSHLQGAAMDVAKEIIYDEIAAKLNMEDFSPTPTSFRIADLGCSVGPNTFNAVHNIIEAIRCCRSGSRIPRFQFQVFFNDFVTNDFNTLFASLPFDRKYHVAAVPGSFYTRLFPESSLHVVHSSYSVQWLSRVPEAVLDRSSAAWNRGRVHYSGAPDEVGEAYASQFAKDMEVFLRARSKEIVRGGIMVLLMLGNRDEVRRSRVPWGFLFDFLGFSLMDMVTEGKISEAEVDSFNVPIYVACPMEITKIVEENGAFNIERIELTQTRSNMGERPSGEALTLNIRSGVESLINKHFGSDIIDELFNHYLHKTKDFEKMMKSGYSEGTQLLVILKRK